MSDYMIGERLKALRLNRKLSQQEVSDRIGTTRSTYSSYENDYSPPDVYILMNLAKLYNVSTDTILFGTNDHYFIPEEFIKILTDLEQDQINIFWTHLLEYAKYLSNK